MVDERANGGTLVDYVRTDLLMTAYDEETSQQHCGAGRGGMVFISTLISGMYSVMWLRR